MTKWPGTGFCLVSNLHGDKRLHIKKSESLDGDFGLQKPS